MSPEEMSIGPKTSANQRWPTIFGEVAQLSRIGHDPRAMAILSALAYTPATTVAELRLHTQLSRLQLARQIRSLKKAGFLRIGASRWPLGDQLATDSSVVITDDGEFWINGHWAQLMYLKEDVDRIRNRNKDKGGQALMKGFPDG